MVFYIYSHQILCALPVKHLTYEVSASHGKEGARTSWNAEKGGVHGLLLREELGTRLGVGHEETERTA